MLELPRAQELTTRWIVRRSDKDYKHLRRELSRGRKAYVVCRW